MHFRYWMSEVGDTSAGVVLNYGLRSWPVRPRIFARRSAMKRYGQFCPIAKSAEILGDPWSILIVRELLLGSSRFSSLQRGLPKISPTVLNTRL
ncbi:helix-turn-helix domain-containing protein, partial [Labrenzia sp. DG1229]|uniref:winged helix-turn-helix transcriptional regulator n=1 Tax=Labrenzia sp. DG1229 TaxID=681847 RepID=UPI001AD908FF